jgi:hypothetical protein
MMMKQMTNEREKSAMSDDFGPPNCPKCGYAHQPTLNCQAPSELAQAPGAATGLTITIVEHPRGYLMRIEHDGAAMTLDRAEAFDLYEKLSAKLDIEMNGTDEQGQACHD